MNQTFGPYSPIRQAGNVYYVSGQVGIDPQTKTAPQTIQEQTKQVLENMKAVLTTAGLTMQDIVKTTIYVTDMGNFAAVNDVYVTYFDQPRPARGTVGVAELPRVGGDTPILVEIEAVAMKGNE